MKIAVKFGLIHAGLSILWTLLMYVGGFNRSESFNMINMLGLIITIACTILAIKEWRTAIGGGYINFGQAFRQALAVCVIGGLISMAFYSFVYLTVIDPGYMDWLNEQQIARFEEMGMPEDQMEEAINQSAKFMTPGWMFTWGIAGSLFFGAIVSLIVAAIMKKPNPNEIS